MSDVSVDAVDVEVAVEFEHDVANDGFDLSLADIAASTDLHRPVGRELRRVAFLYPHNPRAATLTVPIWQRTNSLLDHFLDLHPPQELLSHG